MIGGELLIGGGILLGVLALYVYLAVYVARHAKRRGSGLWIAHGIGVLLFSVTYAGLYFVFNSAND